MEVDYKMLTMQQRSDIKTLVVMCNPFIDNEDAFRAYLGDDPEHNIIFNGDQALREFRHVYLGDYKNDVEWAKAWPEISKNSKFKDFYCVRNLMHRYYFGVTE